MEAQLQWQRVWAGEHVGCLWVPQLTALCLLLCSRCDLCCCLIPCLFDDFKDVTHTCPNCKAYIYTYKRMC